MACLLPATPQLQRRPLTRATAPSRSAASQGHPLGPTCAPRTRPSSVHAGDRAGSLTSRGIGALWGCWPAQLSPPHATADAEELFSRLCSSFSRPTRLPGAPCCARLPAAFPSSSFFMLSLSSATVASWLSTWPSSSCVCFRSARHRSASDCSSSARLLASTCSARHALAPATASASWASHASACACASRLAASSFLAPLRSCSASERSCCDRSCILLTSLALCRNCLAMSWLAVSSSRSLRVFCSSCIFTRWYLAFHSRLSSIESWYICSKCFPFRRCRSRSRSSVARHCSSPPPPRSSSAHTSSSSRPDGGCRLGPAMLTVHCQSNGGGGMGFARDSGE
mmetsp:Transcript_7176/g.18198  ORF Transcript_7176/g.18198 Transcript_7176/m.18198 type:complete len:341 (+) Transcript_7176:208-1230(+)